MFSDVFFVDFKAESHDDSIDIKLAKLFDAAKFNELFHEKDLTAVKLHFGERGNTSFIPPWNVRPLIEKLKSLKAKPFVTDTNTLYVGARKNAVNHLLTAARHGFTSEVVGAPIIIADGLKSNNYSEVPINKKHFKSTKIAQDIIDADSMLVLSHFKGHVMAGFGGAIKNLAMGCAPAAGKIEQHSARPQTNPDLCTGCGTCMSVCPASTIEIYDGKALVHSEACIGCGECIAHCPSKAMELNWEAEIPPFVERLVEYAYGAVVNKKDKVGYISFLVKINPDCDCMQYEDRPLVPDIGILASKDPVAIDKAGYDLVNQQQGYRDSALKGNWEPGQDKFKGSRDTTMGELQFRYGEEIGLGSSQYNLIKL
jgi:uncharacterized Fe-S center protein